MNRRNLLKICCLTTVASTGGLAANSGGDFQLGLSKAKAWLLIGAFDLRLLGLSKTDLEDSLKRRRCFLLLGGRADVLHEASPVPEGAKVRDVLLLKRMEDRFIESRAWRIVKEDRILQSETPQELLAGRRGLRNLENVTVEPGDLIIDLLLPSF